MSDKREHSEMNEKELKQVAGGGRDDMYDVRRLYRCSVCGLERWETIFLGCPTPVCPACRQNGQNVTMTRIG